MSAYFESLKRRSGGTRSPDAIPFVSRPVRQPAPVRRLPKGEIRPEYETLREKLLVASNSRPLRAIAFAGCDGGEGCTRVVREFAETLANSGLRVLLVDADLRTASLTATLAPSGADLTALVTDRRDPAFTAYGDGQLTVVPSPAGYPDKERFFRSAEFAAWLDVQRSRFDYVLLDAPPLLRCADGILMGKLCDGVVMVLRAEVTDRAAVTRAREQLEKAGVPVIGAVLNRAQNPVPAPLRPYVNLT